MTVSGGEKARSQQPCGRVESLQVKSIERAAGTPGCFASSGRGPATHCGKPQPTERRSRRYT